MEFKSAIVDELGTVMKWCSDMTGDEIDECLTVHPEWIVSYVEV